jgi:hypothetical protein
MTMARGVVLMAYSVALAVLAGELSETPTKAFNRR